jgi:hypothetical protein
LTQQNAQKKLDWQSVPHSVIATTRTGWDIFSPFQNTMSQKPHVAIATTIEAMPQPLLMIVVCFLPFQDVVQEVARTCETFHRIAQVRCMA